MPLYEYQCWKCSGRFELRLSIFHNRKKLKCPVCGAGGMVRVFSSASSIFFSGGSCSSTGHN